VAGAKPAGSGPGDKSAGVGTFLGFVLNPGGGEVTMELINIQTPSDLCAVSLKHAVGQMRECCGITRLRLIASAMTAGSEVCFNIIRSSYEKNKNIFYSYVDFV
jgi:hypothetical protein